MEEPRQEDLIDINLLRQLTGPDTCKIVHTNSPGPSYHVVIECFLSNNT